MRMRPGAPDRIISCAFGRRCKRGALSLLSRPSGGISPVGGSRGGKGARLKARIARQQSVCTGAAAHMRAGVPRRWYADKARERLSPPDQ